MIREQADKLVEQLPGARVEDVRLGVVATGGEAYIEIELGHRGTDDGDVTLRIPVAVVEAFGRVLA